MSIKELLMVNYQTITNNIPNSNRSPSSMKGYGLYERCLNCVTEDSQLNPKTHCRIEIGSRPDESSVMFSSM